MANNHLVTLNTTTLRLTWNNQGKHLLVRGSVTRKNRHCLEKLPKNDFNRKMIDFDTFHKLPKNVGDLGKSIVAKGFKKMPKVQ